MNFTFRAFAEDLPGAQWKSHFKKLWPAYKRWFLRYGEHDRPTYFESSRALQRYMPEFVPTYEAMVELSGGGDHAARFLSQYNPPPLFRGCSQAIYRADETVMVRSYDYSPYVFDGLLMHSKFGQRRVIGMLDGMSGLLDGINDDGLAVSLSFGGREEFGEGFGISLVLRFVLEFAGDVEEACALLRRVPIQGAYNIMLLDSTGKSQIAVITAGRDAEFIDQPVATNHQADSHWPLYEEKVLTRERYQLLSEITAEQPYNAYEFSRQFLLPPLYHTRFARGFGTLYDAAFYPQHLSCEYFWPEMSWSFGFDNFTPRDYRITFTDPEGYPKNATSYSEIYTSKPTPVLRF